MTKRKWRYGEPLKRITVKDLAENDSIGNIPGYFQWSMTQNIRWIHPLYRDNRKNMLALFGRQSVTFTSEFKYLVWMFPNRFTVSTAAGYGTRIEVPPDTTMEDAVAFTLQLRARLVEIQP
jgi:hypothetical protein